MKREENEILLESAAGAFRERDSRGFIHPSPAWMDLSPEERDRLFGIQIEIRQIERCIHPSRLSTTARAVLSRLDLVSQYRTRDP
jgi:hypothetical protein